MKDKWRRMWVYPYMTGKVISADSEEIVVEATKIFGEPVGDRVSIMRFSIEPGMGFEVGDSVNFGLWRSKVEINIPFKR